MHCRETWGVHGILDVIRLEQEPGSVALYRVVTDNAELLFAQHRDDQTAADLERSIKAASFLADRGFPTPVFLSTMVGASLLDLGGVLCTLRPWVPGNPLKRERLNSDDMFVLGSTLGWLHVLLAEFPVHAGVDWPNRAAIVAQEIDAASVRISVEHAGAVASDRVLKVLACRRRLLEEAPDLSNKLASHRYQVVHGDYHVDNVVFCGDKHLAGVIDLSVLPSYPILEFYYALFWSLRQWKISAFDIGMARAFLAGYQKFGNMTRTELKAGPEMLYWWLILAMWDTKRYVENPADIDARNGILWFHSLAMWIRDQGQWLGADLGC